MARDLNRIAIMGRVGNDPELRTIGEGTSVLNLSIATSETYNSSDGQKVEKTEWHRVTFWRKAAEIVAQYIKKGDALYVEGPMRYRKWTDDNSVDHTSAEIECSNFHFVPTNKQRDTVGVVADDDLEF